MNNDFFPLPPDNTGAVDASPAIYHSNRYNLQQQMITTASIPSTAELQLSAHCRQQIQMAIKVIPFPLYQPMGH
jgi:hypothetical protein